MPHSRVMEEVFLIFCPQYLVSADTPSFINSLPSIGITTALSFQSKAVDKHEKLTENVQSSSDISLLVSEM